MLQVHLDCFDLRLIVRVVGCDLNESAIFRQNEMMRSRRLAEAHTGVTFTPLHYARMLVGFMC